MKTVTELREMPFQLARGATATNIRSLIARCIFMGSDATSARPGCADAQPQRQTEFSYPLMQAFAGLQTGAKQASLLLPDASSWAAMQLQRDPDARMRSRSARPMSACTKRQPEKEEPRISAGSFSFKIRSSF
ncbi:MAG: hypothetical protein H7A35_05200 [Planctomycetales bacterium]|nr:hypothetical protein [bacterium]UNM09453.1 MAG: hypothetical protein H7A35_05200 [Planctomycetales bacterium]